MRAAHRPAARIRAWAAATVKILTLAPPVKLRPGFCRPWPIWGNDLARRGASSVGACVGEACLDVFDRQHLALFAMMQERNRQYETALTGQGLGLFLL